MPNNNLVTDLTDSILTNNPNSRLLTGLNSGNLNQVTQNVIGFALSLNMETASITQSNNQIAFIKDYLINKIDQLSISDTKSVIVISSALSELTTVPEQISSKSAVKIFDILIDLFKNNFECFSKLN